MVTPSSHAKKKKATGKKKREYELRLYVAGSTPRSLTAIQNITSICEEHLQGRYDLQVIDIFKRPELAREAQIVAIPTLLKKLPLPPRRFIGDLSSPQKLLAGLGLTG